MANVGTLAAELHGGTVTDVHSSLTVMTRAVNSQNTGAGSIVGGLVGVSLGTIGRSSTTGKVIVQDNNIPDRSNISGGLVGSYSDTGLSNNSTEISDSFSSAEVIAQGDNTSNGYCGGLVGVFGTHEANTMKIDSSYSISDVTCTGSYVGGLVGGIDVGTNASVMPVISASFAAGHLTGPVGSETFGLIGNYVFNKTLFGDQDMEFSSDGYDAYLTGSSACGPNGVAGCIQANVDNLEPEYFQNSNNSGFFDTWDSTDYWTLGDGYPIQPAWVARTNAPINLEVTRDGIDFHVSWVNPSLDGTRTDSIVGYQLYYRDQSSSNFTEYSDTMIDENTSSVTISNLAIPGRYVFKVRAKYYDPINNLTNPGLFSDNFDFATGMPATAPGNIQIDAKAKIAQISWDTVESATSYYFQYRPAGTTDWVTGANVLPGETVNQVFVYDLNPSTNYEVRVAAVNVAGEGPWSDPTPFTTITQHHHDVATCQQLQDVSDDPEGIYTQTANIDCTGVDFVPIASGILFLGEYDGNNYTISNVTISQDVDLNPYEVFGVGLFSTTYSATLKNIKLVDSSVAVNYQIDESVDSDQNGLPDAPTIDVPTINQPNSIPTTLPGLQTDVTSTANSGYTGARDIFTQIVQAAGLSGQFYRDFGKVSVGGVAGVVVGDGTYNNIEVTNTTVQGAISGGLFGLLVPIKSPTDLAYAANINIGDSLNITGLKSSGLVVGHIAGGLIGGVMSPLGGLLGSDDKLTISNSQSSSEVQANIGGGLMGIAFSSTGLGLLTAISDTSNQSDPDIATQAVISAVDGMISKQYVVIDNSSSSGLVSSCESISDIRLAVLGGMVGLGFGVEVKSSHSTSNIKQCSNTASSWGLYGGFNGGLGGFMVMSRIVNSYSAGQIQAINDDAVAQYSLVNTYIGANGGLAGMFIAGTDDSDGRYAVDHSYSTSSISIDAKTSLFAVSGGLLGVNLGSPTLKSSYATGNVRHNFVNRSVAGVSVAGGLTGLSVGIDLPFVSKLFINLPSIPARTHGLVIDDCYAKGDVTVTRDDGTSGYLAIGGGLMGMFAGQATVTNSYAEGDVSGGLPDVVNVANAHYFNDFINNSRYGASVSGGLIGTAIGIDVPYITTFGMSIGSDNKYYTGVQSSGLVIDNVHASGSVNGNLAGGLVGSLDLNSTVNKAYAEGAVTGSIAGGLVGQAGFLNAAKEVAQVAAISILAQAVTSPADQNTIAAIGDAFTGVNQGIDPISITNTYTTSNITSTPGLVDVDQSLVSAQTNEATVEPIQLPSTAGGIVGLFMATGGQIKDSYASGDLTVRSDVDFDPINSPDPYVKIAKVPSFAGGIIGIDVSFGSVDYEKVSDFILTSDSNTSEMSDFLDRPTKLQNVFSAANISLNSETISGGTIGLYVSPFAIVDSAVNGRDVQDFDYTKNQLTDNVYLDKNRVKVSDCNGPNKTLNNLAAPLFDNTFIPDENGDNRMPSWDPRSEEAMPANTRAALDAIFQYQTACEYVNSNNSQPRYFIQNKTNLPMKNWNFSNVWYVRKNDYPKFVAGATIDVPGGPNNPTTPSVPAGTGTHTEVTNPEVPGETGTAIRRAGRSVLKKLGYNRNVEQVRGLKAILARVPVFLARSIPYSLILLLLILASMYSYQALREYRQLSIYHRNIQLITNTKESIDNYLAITTHYLNTPVAVMGSAIELMVSMKKMSAAKASSLQTKIKKLGTAAAELLTANQVSNAQSSNDEKLIKRDQPSPFKARAVWVPAGIALGLIVMANILFMYADVFNNSPFRIAVELGLYALGVFLVGLAYRYRNFMAATKEIAKHQLAMESQLYKKREAFIPDAVKIVDEHYENIKIASDSLKKVPEAKLFFNGLNMLGGIRNSLNGLKKFANFEGHPPLFDVSAYIQKAVHERNTNATKLSFDAKVSPGLLTHIEPEEIKQLVDSLLDNAVKFSKDGGRIEVQAYRRFNQLVMSFSDDGIGISEQKLPSLLKPFSRGTESMEYNYEGLGLGLYTDKVIVERLGGKIAIRSKLGEGTVVTLSIPMIRQVEETLPTVLVIPESAA